MENNYYHYCYYYVTDQPTVTATVIALELNVDMVCEKISSKPDDEKMYALQRDWIMKKKRSAMTCQKQPPKNEDPRKIIF